MNTDLTVKAVRTAHCTLCCSDVDVSSHEKGATDKHANMDKHKSNRQAAGTYSLKTLFREATLPQDEKSSPQLCKVYHIFSSQSSPVTNSGVKVDQDIFIDSSTAKG